MTAQDVTRPPMEELAARFQTKSDKIRSLAKAGYSRAEIARFLGIRYQHVRNVLVDDEKTGRQAAGAAPRQGFTQEADRAPNAEQLYPVKAKVESHGRVAIPEEFWRGVGLKENDSVMISVEG